MARYARYSFNSLNTGDIISRFGNVFLSPSLKILILLLKTPKLRIIYTHQIYICMKEQEISFKLQTVNSLWIWTEKSFPMHFQKESRNNMPNAYLYQLLFILSVNLFLIGLTLYAVYLHKLFIVFMFTKNYY